MIPPSVPGQIGEQQNMVGWKNTFNMKQLTLTNLAASYSGGRNGSIAHFMNGGCITSPAKSLDLLRRNLQNAINKDIDVIIRKYLEKFFQPAINNIKMNLGKNSINDELIRTVCQQILEDAKIMYKVSLPSGFTPFTYNDSDGYNAVDSQSEKTTPAKRKRKESDTDSDTSCVTNNKHKSVSRSNIDNLTYKLPEKREGPKWNPDRINQNTLFIMGAKANKVLGFGQTRGRLYVRHPNILRYPSDAEDKEWLTANSLMTPSGGKAYLMLLEDVTELALSDDYRNNPNLQLQDLYGFEAPFFMINKVKSFIENFRTDKIQPPVNMEFDFQPEETVTLSSSKESEPTRTSEAFVLADSTDAYSTPNNTRECSVILSIPDPDPSPSPKSSFIPRHLSQNATYSINNVPQKIVISNHKELSNHTESNVPNVEKIKRRRILDDLISTHGTVESS